MNRRDLFQNVTKLIAAIGPPYHAHYTLFAKDKQLGLKRTGEEPAHSLNVTTLTQKEVCNGPTSVRWCFIEERLRELQEEGVIA